MINANKRNAEQKILNNKKLFAIVYCFNILSIILMPASEIKKE